MRRAYIYVLRAPDDERPRYVGFTTNPRARLALHVSAARCAFAGRSLLRVTPVHEWILELLSEGKRPVIEVIDRAEDTIRCGRKRAAREAERRWARKLFHAGEPLLNLQLRPRLGALDGPWLTPAELDQIEALS